MIDIAAPSFREHLRGAPERHEGFALAVEIVPATARRIPGCELEVLEGVGHDPMFEVPEQIADLAIRFLAKHRLASAP